MSFSDLPEFDFNELVDDMQANVNSPSLNPAAEVPKPNLSDIDKTSPVHKLIISREDALRLTEGLSKKTKKIKNLGDIKYMSCFLCNSTLYFQKMENWMQTKELYGFKMLKKNNENRREGVLIPLGKNVDHRVLGKEQNLFFQHELSPGSWFFGKEGTTVFNNLVSMLRQHYKYRGFDEVISPNLYNLKLFKISGHYQNYKDNMFMLKANKQGMAIKPMNCPGHYLIYKSKSRSYRELPLRFAEFGVLHRDELSGAMTGLSRCRRFHVDD